MFFQKNPKNVRRFLIFTLIVVALCVNFKGTQASAAPNTLMLSVEYDESLPARQVTVKVLCPNPDSLQEVAFVGVRAAKVDYFTKHVDRCTWIEKDENGEYFFIANENCYYSVYAKDNSGTESMIQFKLTNIDKEAPSFSLDVETADSPTGKNYVTATVKDNVGFPVSVCYVSGCHPDATDAVWKSAKTLTPGERTKFTTGTYSFLATDTAGNTRRIIQRIGKRAEEEEFRAVWIAYYDFKTTGYTEEEFREQVVEMFTNVIIMNMNAVVVHVRPFSDAMYPSKYFPWSRYCSGTQGNDPGFDPLEIMVAEAHRLGLEFHAWLNPYRVSNTTTDVTTLSEDHPARIYRTDSNKNNDRNVLSYGGKLYYNPASAEVQKLIVNGIKEIVENYEVDGIHFDDYFYPALGQNYKTNFDAPEYEAYKKKQIAAKKSYLSIEDWRRENVNNLVRTIYSAVKEINPKVVFGISPGGFMDALRADDKYYVDFDTWVSHDGYIDYLCPQLYWSNDHSVYPYNEILKRFSDAMINPDVKLYIGIGAYKAGIKTEGNEWQKNPNVLRNMIIEGRKLDNVYGFVLFDYSHIMSKKNYTTMKNMMKEFQ